MDVNNKNYQEFQDVSGISRRFQIWTFLNPNKKPRTIRTLPIVDMKRRANDQTGKKPIPKKMALVPLETELEDYVSSLVAGARSLHMYKAEYSPCFLQDLRKIISTYSCSYLLVGGNLKSRPSFTRECMEEVVKIAAHIDWLEFNFITFDTNALDPLIEHLSSNSTLESLTIHIPIWQGYTNINKLFPTLAKNTSLTLLSIIAKSENLSGDEIDIICDSLRHNTTLRWFYLNFGTTDCYHRQKFNLALKNNFTLLHLELPYDLMNQPTFLLTELLHNLLVHYYMSWPDSSRKSWENMLNNFVHDDHRRKALVGTFDVMSESIVTILLCLTHIGMIEDVGGLILKQIGVAIKILDFRGFYST